MTAVEPNRAVLEAVLESCNSGILVLDDGDVSAYNDRLLDVWGFDDPGSKALLDTMEARTLRPQHAPWHTDQPGVVELEDGRRLDVDRSEFPTGAAWSFEDVTKFSDAEFERYETILRTIGDPVYAVDAKGRCTFANRAYFEESGLGPEDLFGTYVEEFRRPGEVAKVRSLIRELIESEEQNEGTVEMERVNRDGETRIVENHIALLPEGSDGTYRGSVGILRDITQRKKRERRLEQYRSLVDAMNDPAAAYDTEGRLVLANAMLAKWFGEDPEDLVGQKSELLEQLANDRGSHPLEDLLSGECDEIRGELVTGDLENERGVVEYILSPIEVEGERTGIVAVSRNITERKARERELRQTRTILQTVVDHLPSGVVVEDGEGEIILVNDALADVLGPTSLEGLDGSTMQQFLDDQATDFVNEGRFVETYEDHRQRREPRMGEEWELTGGRIIERNYIPYKLLDDPAHLWIYRDISDRKTRELELEEKNERLEKFASIVSHDLRNPLNVAQGRVELLKEEIESDHLSSLSDAHDRMEALIQDLLMTAREEDPQSVEERVDLPAMFRNCWGNVATESATSEIDTTAQITADPTRLSQLLENVIRNAVEHGGGDVVVRIGDLEDGFFIEDDGTGIPEDERTTIFDPGYSTNPSGTGLGLNIVQQIANEHGWDVSVDAGVDSGARFEFRNVNRV